MECGIVFVLTLEQNHGHDMSTVLGVYRTLATAMNYPDTQHLIWQGEVDDGQPYWFTPNGSEFYQIVQIPLS